MALEAIEDMKPRLTGLGPASNRHEHPYHLDKLIIHDDLVKEKPEWVLSAYGPGRGAPLQLFGGYPREQSFEEVRLRYYELALSGNQQQAVQEEQQLVANAEQQIQTALRDVNGAIRYIVSGEKEHPNRIDICEAQGMIASQAEAVATTQPKNPFSQSPAFGQPSAPVKPAPAFGQPAAFDRPTTSFGQTPQLGQSLNPFASSAPAFGQPAPLASQPAPAFGQSPFGQPSAPAPAFGQPTNATSFQQTSNPFINTQTPAFGLPSQPTEFISQSTPSFGTGFSSQPAMTSQSPFGGQPASQSTPFGAPPIATTTGFGFNAAQLAGPGRSAPSSGTTRKDGSGRLTVWHGKSITYVDDEPCFKRSDGLWEKVWFPDATPSWTKDLEVPEGMWTEEVKEEYDFAREHGEWKDGVMPDIMPKREWVSWDF
ncbi:hypothetical protein MMC13_000221 [Lambiella insularis]|nr:hypothetical protein [Lambiella insularis]